MRENRKVRRALLLLGLGLLMALLLPGRAQAADADVSLSLGYQFGGVAGDDGVLYVWGQNYYGILGNGTGGDGEVGVKYAPQTVSLSGNVVDLSMGYQTAAAILDDGTLWTWGSNVYGQLGDASATLKGTTINATPTKVSLPSKAVSVAAGTTSSAAVLSDGSVYTWGGVRYLSVFDNSGKPLYYSAGTVPIYRVYNAALNGMHHLTTDTNEYATLPKYGWTQEGAKIYAYKKGTQITTTYYKKSWDQQKRNQYGRNQTRQDSLQQ